MDNYRYRKLFSNLPQIDTERLLLKKIVIENAGDMYEYASLNVVSKYLLWSPHLNLHSTKGYIEYLQREYKKGSYADWGITLKSENKFIGTIGFSNIDLENNNAEIGYVLNPSYWGNGYMGEALEAVIRLTFDSLHIRRLQARIMEGNTASEKIMLKLGFKYEGTLRDYLLVKGEYRNIKFYSLLETEYYAAK
ncbi:GNAT family N-acetyltransferase [Eubacteriales bacterium OttesenSCG-928-G02]|nr:GNAT family N-acetyltransferase [Eubacteriales bacterium OttesenSCG-928-G02]